jgi:hypothetical protein
MSKATLKQENKSKAVDEEYELVRVPLTRTTVLREEKELDSSPLGKSLTMDLGSANASHPSMPPRLNLLPSRKITFGFANSSATLQNITVGGLLGAAGMIGATAAHAYAVHSGVKLKRIRIWSGGSTSAQVTSFVQWIGNGSNVPDKSWAIASVRNIATATALEFKPPKNSLAEFWYNLNASGTQIFAISCAVGSVIYVDLELTQSIEFSPLLFVSAGSNFSVGGVTYGHLDGSSATYAPVGLPVAADV